MDAEDRLYKAGAILNETVSWNTDDLVVHYLP
jgi:hypothetical protein